MLRRAGLAFILLSLLACDENSGIKGPEAARAEAARRMVEGALRETAGGRIVTRGVQVYAQAAEGSSAVCGQVNLQPASGAGLFTLFVAIVTPEGGAEQGGRYMVEQHVATSSTTASRVFVEMVSRCYEGGGPQPGQRAGAPPPMPPVPDRLPTPGMAAPEAQATPGGTPALAPTAHAPEMGGRQVTLRQGGNLRVHPHGGGAVLRIVPQGTRLRVFGEAPGGWLQVGDSEPWGWMHDSLMVR